MDKQAKIDLLVKKLFNLYHSTDEESLEELQTASFKLSLNQDLSKIVYSKLEKMIFEENNETAICNYVVADIIEALKGDSESDSQSIISTLLKMKKKHPESFNKIIEILKKALIGTGDAEIISRMAEIAKSEDLFDISELLEALADLDEEFLSANELIDII